MDLVDRFKHRITSPCGEVVSFNVMSLFSNTPAEMQLRKVNVHASSFKDFINLLTVRLTADSYLCFKFPEDMGMPIRSPLGSLMGDLFVDLLESSDHKSRRIVDDVLFLEAGPGGFYNS